MGDTSLLIVGTGAVVGALVLLLLAIVPKSSEPEGAIIRRKPAKKKKSRRDAKVMVEQTSEFLVGRADEFIRESSRSPVSEQDLALAGFPGTAGAALVLVAVATTFVVLSIFITTGQLLLGVILGATVPMIARVVLTIRVDRVRNKFADQLDEGLQIIAAALRAGHAFPAALSSVSQNTEEPMRGEFARIVNQNRIGRDLVEAMTETAARMDCEDFRWVTEAVATHRETGGNLNVIIDRVATTIRERKELREQVKALSAEGRFSGVLLMLLPVGIVVLFTIINPTYMQDLYITTVGQVVLAVSLVMYVIGGFWIRKVVRVEL